ncbi:RmlC-like cupin domain-containing protein [Chaetomium strumarium]|uniref:RmlC-like cupin domain-containing protein n=1 Tax=Chaetomium strumarium TaxID=1170767 RepID=A0AAJ0GUK7_9PEZI|nr:RmlC-like cupin domain-containing protein [Chaetomium strumarium]
MASDIAAVKAKYAGRPRETLKLLYDHELPNCPGKSIVGLELSYAPGGWSPPHRHAGATVVAYVLEGEFLSGMNGHAPKVYRPGEQFVELPGCHHTVSDNASSTEPMRAIVVFVVDTAVLRTERGYAALVEVDQGWEDA